MNYLIYALISLLSSAMLTMMGYKIFQIFQLSSYKGKGVLNWIKASKFDYIVRYFAAGFFSFIAMLVFIACFGKFNYVPYVGLIFYFLFGLLFILFTLRQKSKKPLKLTARMIRFAVVSFILFYGASFGILALSTFNIVLYSLLGLLQFIVPFVIFLACYILLPFETLNNLGYRNRAIKKLQSKPGLIKIGITGSYGKTTTKNILAAMLQTQYNVCFSPSSYNTPMGISKVINNSLNDDAQIFIAEMGARNQGDIKELSQIVSPNFGIITAIGNQHLETFGSIDVIKKTKYELIENLAIGGLAVFNGDSPLNIDLYHLAEGAKILTGEEPIENADITYSNSTTNSNGTSFQLKIKDTVVPITTKLLGKHIPSLICCAAAVATALNVTPENIAHSLCDLEAVPHRLQLIDMGDTIIIDDAYNSNTEGAYNALLLLKNFDATKIVITPGIVELGAQEKEANLKFGAQIAQCADYAFLLGNRAEIIKEGAIQAGMDANKIVISKSTNEAVENQKNIDGKKVILFENDLPDNI